MDHNISIMQIQLHSRLDCKNLHHHKFNHHTGK